MPGYHKPSCQPFPDITFQVTISKVNSRDSILLIKNTLVQCLIPQKLTKSIEHSYEMWHSTMTGLFILTKKMFW
jgi:sulfur transfer complex TusBCD TusB component (DsrH family)